MTRLSEAISFAAQCHDGMLRKGIPVRVVLALPVDPVDLGQIELSVHSLTPPINRKL